MDELVGVQSIYKIDPISDLGVVDISNPSKQEIITNQTLIQKEISKGNRSTKEPPYLIIYTKNTVEQFLKRYMLGSLKPQTLVLVSPFISTFEGEPYELKDVLHRAKRDRTLVYVVTRKPEAEYQLRGIELLRKFPYVEIRYNPDIHAKLYISWGREIDESYAFFGSGNLTSGGLKNNLELGMMILARGDGKSIINKLYKWGSHDIRVISKIEKQIKH